MSLNRLNIRSITRHVSRLDYTCTYYFWSVEYMYPIKIEIEWPNVCCRVVCKAVHICRDCMLMSFHLSEIPILRRFGLSGLGPC